VEILAGKSTHGEKEICASLKKHTVARCDRALADPFSFLSLSHAHAKDQQEQSMSLLHLASFRPRNSNDMMTSEALCSSSSCHQQPEIKVSSSIALTPENNIYLGWQQLVWWQKLSLIIISISAFFAKASYDHTRGFSSFSSGSSKWCCCIQYSSICFK
jgi:hypothetical protein